MTAIDALTPRKLDQGSYGDLLLNRARGEHPTIAWWWGRRRLDGTEVAYCYCCDQAIVQWDGTAASWRRAQPTIDQHRLAHLAELRAEITPTPEAH